MNLLGNFLTSIKPRLDDTAVDRLNYYYSTLIITVMALTLTARQYVGQPLQCWVPAEFSKAWEQYAENYCFVYNTYWVSPEDNIPSRIDERVSRQLLYYQWVPFIMALQAGCFYLPVIFYGKVISKSGVCISDVIRTLSNAEKTDKAARSNAVTSVCSILQESLRLMQVRRVNVGSQWGSAMMWGQLDGTYMSNMYTFTKLLYLLNVGGQFVLVNQLLGQDDHAWGFHILRDIARGRDWELSGNFPRVALCDFTVRTPANVHRFTIQCVLMLNMFNEKIFLFLYWWLVLVALLTLADLLRWQVQLRNAARRVAYVKRFIKPDPSQHAVFREFCRRVIQPDFVFVVEMICIQVNELYAQEVLMAFWYQYRTDAQLQDIVTKLDPRRLRAHSTQSAAELSEDSDEEDNSDSEPAHSLGFLGRD